MLYQKNSGYFVKKRLLLEQKGAELRIQKQLWQLKLQEFLKYFFCVIKGSMKNCILSFHTLLKK
jgi:hypothetical protein